MIIKYQFKKLQAILEEGEGGGGVGIPCTHTLDF